MVALFSLTGFTTAEGKIFKYIKKVSKVKAQTVNSRGLVQSKAVTTTTTTTAIATAPAPRTELQLQLQQKYTRFLLQWTS
jgi:hypothetical protein